MSGGMRWAILITWQLLAICRKWLIPPTHKDCVLIGRKSLWVAGTLSWKGFTSHSLSALFFPLVTSSRWRSTHVWTAALRTPWSIVSIYAGVFVPLCSSNACWEDGRWKWAQSFVAIYINALSLFRARPLFVWYRLPACYQCVCRKVKELLIPPVICTQAASHCAEWVWNTAYLDCGA